MLTLGGEHKKGISRGCWKWDCVACGRMKEVEGPGELGEAPCLWPLPTNKGLEWVWAGVRSSWWQGLSLPPGNLEERSLSPASS